MKTIKYILLSAVLIGFTACNDEEDFDMTEAEVVLPELTAGSATLSNYVSLGNSLTAGFTDNALFIAGQENSFPNTLSQKFALLGGGAFTQPLMNDNFGGMTLGGTRILQPRLVFGGAGPVPLESIIGPVSVSTELSSPPSGPFNNLGVPGAASFHLIAPGYGNLANFPTAANPYGIRVAGNTDTTILELAMAQAPTFFSLWIGNNDVLGYATSGGAAGALTDQATFDFAYSTLISTLTSQGAQGVVANIPDVTTIPFFTTVPHNPLDPSNPAFGPQIPTLNATFAQLNAAYAFLGMPERSIVFSETEASAVIINDESIANIATSLSAVLQGGGLDPVTAGLLANQFGQSRQATAADLLTLTSSTVIATLNEDYFNLLVGGGVPPATAGQLAINGVTFPLADQWVLIPSEQDEIAQATNGFNATISASASQAGLAFVDANGLLTQLANGGITSGDFTLTSNLVTGSAFSLDGVHPTARGYALIANEFMRAIDVTYGSNFEASGNFVDVGNYPTNYSPALQ